MSYLVQFDEGRITVEAEVSVELRGDELDCRLDGWWINDVEMPRKSCPDGLLDQIFELAEDEYIEDTY